MNIVFDTCVIVDILQKREPFCEDAVNLLYAVSNQQINGIITAKSLTDIYYLLRKSLNEQAVRELLSNMTELFDIVDTTGADCKLALISDMKDYEDAIMVETAKRMKADGIVTRNLKDGRRKNIFSGCAEANYTGVAINVLLSRFSSAKFAQKTENSCRGSNHCNYLP